ncbi:MAG TPA: capsule assembly Wzi family protein, partial [Mucilaginibacter sp.]|nr:capsule assembly Wzi family protein [Mucilaginibacter sp.]
MKRIFFILSMVLGVVCITGKVNAQAIPVGTPVLDDYYRRMQLLGKVDSNLSFTVRPIFPGSATQVHDVYDPDSTLKHDYLLATGPVTFAKERGVFQILPLTWQQQFNSNHPYGWNDEAMIPAKGYQTMISGGFYIKFGPLSIQLRPEYVYATNPDFNGYAPGHSGQELTSYYYYHNFIDNPERYGNGAYSKVLWGQSSIKLTFGPISMGLSNESLWWGPGIRNALILSDNAPGFKHLILNTVRPIKTVIGYFEGQVIAGRLDVSAVPPLMVTALPDGTNLYIPKENDWRYFTGFNINYHPKWIHGLTFGLTRTFDAYYNDVKVHGFSAYVPFFFPYSKQADTGGADSGIGDPFPRDQYTSFYTRLLFTKAQAEIYFEYGLNDNSYNLSDFIGSPDHSRAYIFGLRKMLSINGSKDQHILFSGEITQLSQSTDRLVRDAGGWYVHAISAGQTNKGKVLGAGTGSGGNLQSMDISWVSGLKKLGIGIERYEHDVDFSQLYFPDINNNSRNWVDFAFALQGEWNYKNLIFNAKLQEIKSLNYEWILKDYNPGQYYIPHND